MQDDGSLRLKKKAQKPKIKKSDETEQFLSLKSLCIGDLRVLK